MASRYVPNLLHFVHRHAADDFLVHQMFLFKSALCPFDNHGTSSRSWSTLIEETSNSPQCLSKRMAKLITLGCYAALLVQECLKSGGTVNVVLANI